MSNKHKPIHDYMTHEDLFLKAGYRHYNPKIGSLGKAIIEASKLHRSVGWLKEQINTFFKKLRKHNGKKENHKYHSSKVISQTSGTNYRTSGRNN